MELIIIVVVVAVLVYVVLARRRRAGTAADVALEDARTDARRWVERLRGQVDTLAATPATELPVAAPTGEAADLTDEASAIFDRAVNISQFALARQTAVEGLYYVRAARTAAGLEPGPPLPPLPGQQIAGAAEASREVEVAGGTLAVAPEPSARTPYHFPGGRIARRPVPAGWYSQRWWQSAAESGAWPDGSVAVFDALFTDLPGIGYGGAGFASGYGTEHEWDDDWDDDPDA